MVQCAAWISKSGAHPHEEGPGRRLLGPFLCPLAWLLLVVSRGLFGNRKGARLGGLHFIVETCLIGGREGLRRGVEHRGSPVALLRFLRRKADRTSGV